MPEVRQKWMHAVTLALVLLMLLAVAPPSYGKKKKKEEAPPPAEPAKLDLTKFVWPPAPAVPRLRFLNFFSAEQAPPPRKQRKMGWMDRMAGVAEQGDMRAKPRFGLWSPYGLAVDSKDRLYVADSKVGAIFVFDTETGGVELIKHRVAAEFGWILGLAIDDDDRLFVSDSKLHHVLVFNSKHKLEAKIEQGMVDPAGMAIDKENRLLYVADTGLDQVLVFDADSLMLLRKIGTTGKDHTLTTPGDFSKPSNVALDQEGNLYVTDTMNNRVEVFDAEGTFIRTFGKNGDGFGDFARPKGIAIDADGHVWVADAMLNRLQVFTPEGQPLMAVGGFGLFPGKFQALAGLTIDQQNRIFTTEQFPGRVQMFRYVTDAEARKELQRLKPEAKKADVQKPEGKDSSDAKGQPAGGPSAAKPEMSGASK